MKTKSQLSIKIRKARINAGLSQKVLAKKLGVSDKTISAYESNRAIPPVITLHKISEYTNQNLDYFVKSNSAEINHVNGLSEIGKKLDSIISELKKLNEK